MPTKPPENVEYHPTEESNHNQFIRRNLQETAHSNCESFPAVLTLSFSGDFGRAEVTQYEN
jgi:hypothetical protein